MIRIAQIGDLPGIVEIYNQAIEAKFQTAYTEMISVDDRVGWFYDHTPEAYPLYVYEADDKVVAWVSVSPYRPGRDALRFCVEVSYFVHNSYLRKGIGSQMLQYILDVCKELKYRSVLAILLDRNVASSKLLEKFRFQQWAFLPDVADFDGEICSHVYYGKSLVPVSS
jgi:L-amino acid N-acyltransferase YncA